MRFKQFLRLAVSSWTILLAGLGGSNVLAQAPATAAAQAGGAAQKPPLRAEELEQMLAPLALYPDSLLTQILMASTYPLEVVQADRWAKAHTDLKGDALATELEKQPWDPSVRSLVNFPTVLAMMSEKLDITMKIGDAFLAQQKDVLNTVQKLRAKAQAEGNLKSNEQQKVTVEAAPPAAAGDTTVVVQQQPAQIITIESSQPDVIYVPQYNPTVVYGSWPYPSYPPAPYYPPGYVASNMISFGLGVACGAAWGYAWGNCNWGGGDVDIDVNRNANFNRNIDRSKYQQNIQNRQAGAGGRQGSWQHDPSHRKGVSYRDQATSQKFGGANRSNQAVQSREAYRGRAEAGRQDLSRGGASEFRGNNPQVNPQNRAGNVGQGQNRAGQTGAANRAGTGAQNRPSAAPANRASPSAGNRSTATRSNSFSGVNSGGASARQSSQRGQASRSASPSRSAPSRSAGGGGARAPRGGGGGGGRR